MKASTKEREVAWIALCAPVDSVKVFKLDRDTKTFLRAILEAINRAVYHAYHAGQEGAGCKSVTTILTKNSFEISFERYFKGTQ